MANHQEIVKKLLDTKAVDFTAIGKMVADLGPSLSLRDEPWENFCLTMKLFLHVYRRPYPFPWPNWPIESLGKLGEAVREK